MLDSMKQDGNRPPITAALANRLSAITPAFGDNEDDRARQTLDRASSHFDGSVRRFRGTDAQPVGP